MRIRQISFANWLRSPSHRGKAPRERWLRELYPWHVFARLDYDPSNKGKVQRVTADGVVYDVTLKDVKWQPQHRTFRNRLLIESDGLGWSARAWCDEIDLCATADGTFVTAFHRGKEEPLERIHKFFFARRWDALARDQIKSLQVSRYLAANVVADVVEQGLRALEPLRFPGAGILDDDSPLYSSADGVWIGYRFFSEDAFAWARRVAGRTARVLAIYFADTRYQFLTDLPDNCRVRSIDSIDGERLDGRHRDLTTAILRCLELPSPIEADSLHQLIIDPEADAASPILEADVNEAFAALRRPASSKAELRYQLAAGVLLNAWVESERRFGFTQRKKFYAFKQSIANLVLWARASGLDGVVIWSEQSDEDKKPIVFVRIDDVDFSFRSLPMGSVTLPRAPPGVKWSGVRLKPLAPLVLRWSRSLLPR